MNAKFERWKRSYNRGLSYHGVPENEHTDKMARVYFARGWSAKAAAYDEMVEYIEYKRALRKRILQQALFPAQQQHDVEEVLKDVMDAVDETIATGKVPERI